MSESYEPSGRPVSEILGDAVGGRRISAGDAHTLLLDGELIELGLAAHAVRNQHNDSEYASYNIDRNINYTNVCVYKCRFCAFYREPGHEEGYLLSNEEIGRKVEETLALNGTGILMQGGVHPDLPLSYYEELMSYLSEHYPECHLHAFSPPEVKFIAKKERMSFYDVIARLKAAGLMSIPGGGAEVLSDDIRRDVLAYPKCSAEEWIDIMRQAHRNDLRTSATMMYGMGEDARGAVRAFRAHPRPAGRDRRLHRVHFLDLPAGAHRSALGADTRSLRSRIPEDPGGVAALHRQRRSLPGQLGDPGQEDRPGSRCGSGPTTWARS